MPVDRADIFATSLVLQFFIFNIFINFNDYYVFLLKDFALNVKYYPIWSLIINSGRIWFCCEFLISLHEIFKVTIWKMINCNLLKLFFIWILHYKVVRRVFFFTSLSTLKYDCLIKTSEMFSFLPLINI